MSDIQLSETLTLRALWDKAAADGTRGCTEWVYKVTPRVAYEFQFELFEEEKAYIDSLRFSLEYMQQLGEARILLRVDKNAQNIPDGKYEEWDENDALVRDGLYDNGKADMLWFDKNIKNGPYLWCIDGRNPLYLRAASEEALTEKLGHYWGMLPPPSPPEP